MHNQAYSLRAKFQSRHVVKIIRHQSVAYNWLIIEEKVAEQKTSKIAITTICSTKQVNI